MNDKPISTFDEICRITIDTMRKMELETLLQLKKQATIEFDRAKLTKGCIELALSLKQGDQQAVSKEEADDSQQSLLTNLED
jgi:hypothetical protein